MKPIKKNKFIQLWLILGITAGFIATIFFSITYLNNRVLCDIDCRIQNEVSIVLILVSLFGMFIGSLTYYFISEKYEKKMLKRQKDTSVTLNFLGGEEKAIVSSIINNNGETTQSRIVKDTGISKVKMSRVLKKLEQKEIIIKIPSGMTNKIKLEKRLKNLFFE